MLQRGPLVARVLIVQHEVALAERAALGVFSAQPDRNSLGEQTGERQALGMCPVDRVLQRGLPPLELAPELRKRREALRPAVDQVVQRTQPVVPGRRERLAPALLLLRQHLVPVWPLAFDLHPDSERRSGGRLVDVQFDGIFVISTLDDGSPRFVQACRCFLGHHIDLRLLEDPFLHQSVSPDLPHRRMPADLLVHQRLRVRRLVALVVAVPAVPDEVDDDVFRKCHVEVDRQLDRGEARLGIIRVHVQDRKPEAQRDVARVAAGARVVRIGREPELVVGHDVNRAAVLVAGQPGQVEGLGYDSLPHERGVPVHQDRENGRPERIQSALVLAGQGHAASPCEDFPRGARHPLDDRVHVLEMARIRGERDLQFADRRA